MRPSYIFDGIPVDGIFILQRPFVRHEDLSPKMRIPNLQVKILIGQR